MLLFLSSKVIFVCLFSTGVVICLIALYVKNHQPKEPNKTYGYRTARSMRSQDAWEFAQEYSIDWMIRSSIGMCILGILSVPLKVGEVIGALLSIFLIIAVIAVPFVLTERELKKRFE